MEAGATTNWVKADVGGCQGGDDEKVSVCFVAQPRGLKQGRLDSDESSAFLFSEGRDKALLKCGRTSLASQMLDKCSAKEKPAPLVTCCIARSGGWCITRNTCDVMGGELK